MNHFRAFTNSIATAARDLTKDISCKIDDKAVSVGKRYTIGGRDVQEGKLLSEGGFGFVYLAHDIRTNTPYVLKKILCQDKERLDLARREIEIFEKLPLHPNLVRYFGHIIEKDSRSKEVVLLLEYCPGGHLFDLMQKSQGAVPFDAVMKVLGDVTGGLMALQTMSPPVQHRDLKLENVLLNESGNYVLLDFGSWSSESPDLSKLPRDQLMNFGDTVERYTTLMYRPPEMADLYKGFKISGKVDIWMLGCILFTLMNNKHPFQNASNLAIVNCRYQFDQTECKRYPQKLVELCAWLLAQNPDDRPSAVQLKSILDEWDARIDDPLLLPRQVMDRIEKDARLYGIPRSVGRQKDKEAVQAAVAAGDAVWTRSESSATNGWEANFSNLIDIHHEKEAAPTESFSIPDLLG